MSPTRLTLIAGLTFLLFLNSRAALAQAASEQAIVDSFYPVARLHPDSPDRREMCYQVAAADADGKATRIVAGYTDTDEAVLRVLDREQSGAFRISYESPADLDMYARGCEITVADLDGDGSKDVFMELSADKGSYAWMFRGVGTTLEPLQKIRGNPGLVDLYHDGSQQVEVVADVDYYSGDHVRVWLELYKVRASGVVLDSPVLALGSFEPGDTGFLGHDIFDLQDGVKPPYVLRIVNGLRGGKRRATGISISINDVPLKAATALTNKTEFLEIPLSIPLVKDNNEMDVTVTGPPDATVLVVIRSGARK